jgi:hypothetical protein
MGRRYVLTAENMTLGTGSVLAAIQSAAAAAAGSILGIERVEVTQNHNAVAAQVRPLLGTRDTAGTFTLTSSTPRPLVLGGPASGISGNVAPAGAAARCGTNSSADTGGTYTDTYYVNNNNLGGFGWVPIPEHKIIVPPSTLFVVRFAAAPADTAGWTVSVWFDEIF